MDKKYSLKKWKKIPPLTRLFDRWIPEALTMLGALKFLQFLRLLGLRASVNGWRKVTSIFLRGESSKFILASLRIDPDAQALLPAPDFHTASVRLAAKLAAYLRRTEDIRYWVDPGRLAFVRRRHRFCDLVLAEVDNLGMIVKLTPFLDREKRDLRASESPLLEETLQSVCYYSNKLRELPEHRRAIELLKSIKSWARSRSRFHYFGRRRRMWLAERILHATILFCEQMPDNDERELLRERFCMPDFRKYRNPALGMMGVLARFTPDFREVDLWCQFNHVATDGLPMQEFLSQLKQDWGSVGATVYPPLKNNTLSSTQIRYAGDGNFRALFFADFSLLLKIRSYLNRHYQYAMGGTSSIAGLVMWGLTRHEAFVKQKILLPVDAGLHDGDRHLGLLMIRPRHFEHKNLSQLESYCAFQTEMNRRMLQARNGAGAVTEFLELCALMHPFFYHLARKIWPRALNEVLGTAGLSILKDAEVFVSPMTEFQRSGFIGIGNLTMPTVDGKTAAAVSITGTRSQIRNALEATRTLPYDLLRMLELEHLLDEQTE